MEFRDYLNKQGFSSSTINGKINTVMHLEKWLQKKRINYPISYTTAVNYLTHLKKEQYKPKTLNMYLATLSQYMHYCIHHKAQTDNPFNDLRVSGVSRNRLYTDILSSEEIEDLYYSFLAFAKEQTVKHQQMSVMVGLICYQGLSVTELKRLKVEHLHLHKGRIYVPGGRVGARRKLPLQAPQILALQQYITIIYPTLNIERLEYLFPQSIAQLSEYIRSMFKILKQINNKVRNSKHLRGSVIIYWLSKYNLRTVQYMAGHRHIRATELYRQDKLENLKQMVETLHPLR